MSFPPGTEMFQFPGFAFDPYGFRIKYYFSEDRGQTTDDSEGLRPFRPLSSDNCLLEVGFPIRKSADQSFLAAPNGLSQRSTSFIASQRQGIHRMPLRHLIALIINTHPDNGHQMTDDRNLLSPSSVLRRPVGID